MNFKWYQSITSELRLTVSQLVQANDELSLKESLIKATVVFASPLAQFGVILKYKQNVKERRSARENKRAK